MPSLLEWCLFIDQTLFYATTLMLIGLCAGRALDGGESPRKSLHLAMIIIVLAAFSTRLVLLNASFGGALSGAFNSDTFNWVWAIYSAQTYLIAAGLLAAALSLRVASRVTAAIAALFLSASFAMAGHTRALDEPGAWPWIAALHVLVAGFWLAAPIRLWPGKNTSQKTLRRRTELFSRFAILLIPLLFIAGVALAIHISGGASQLLRTQYGALLIAKLSAACLVLLVGAFNKLAVGKKLREPAPSGRAALKAALAIDAVLFTAIVAIIAWVTTIAGPGDH